MSCSARAIHITRPSQRDTHAAPTGDLGFAKQAQLGIWLCQRLLETTETDFAGFTINQDHTGRRRAVQLDVRNRQSENGAHMQRKF